jgi:threonine dehydratase
MDALRIALGIDIAGAAERLEGHVRHTPLESFDISDSRIHLKLKLECEQETGAFKARGAVNQILSLTPEERAAGVCATSSGNHGRALAWAARRAGVKTTLFMPHDVYATKLEACRAEGAEVVLCASRATAEEECARHVGGGAILIHPYDSDRTIEGAGTVGWEIAEDWPEVELVLFPVGGGGMLAGSALAIARRLGDEVAVLGVEPVGSANMSRAMAEGRPVAIDPIETSVQGLCPIEVGVRNLGLCLRYVEGMVQLSDDEIYAGQRELVRAGYTVEPAGAAAFAAVLHRALPDELLEGRTSSYPLRTVCVLSGGNADPEQLETLK